MLTREEHVTFCEKCTNRKPTMQGLLCKLTDEKVDFEETCPNFNLDELESFNLEKQRRDAAKIDYGTTVMQDEVSVLNGGIIGGSLAIIGAIVWFFGAWIYMDIIFFYPPILFVVGVIGLMRGIKAKNEKKKKKLRENDVLDSGI